MTLGTASGITKKISTIVLCIIYKRLSFKGSCFIYFTWYYFRKFRFNIILVKNNHWEFSAQSCPNKYSNESNERKLVYFPFFFFFLIMWTYSGWIFLYNQKGFASKSSYAILKFWCPIYEKIGDIFQLLGFQIPGRSMRRFEQIFDRRNGGKNREDLFIIIFIKETFIPWLVHLWLGMIFRKHPNIIGHKM